MKLDPVDFQGYVEYPDDALIELVAAAFTPERVFAGRESELADWAEDRGYYTGRGMSDITMIDKLVEAGRDVAALKAERDRNNKSLVELRDGLTSITYEMEAHNEHYYYIEKIESLIDRIYKTLGAEPEALEDEG